MANPYRSSQGLTVRPLACSDEIQLRIDPIHADLDEEISGLHKQVKQLKHVAQEIETEARVQNDLVPGLKMLMSRAQAGVKNGMTKLNRTVAQKRSNHVLQVIVFGLAFFTIVYLWSKYLRDDDKWMVLLPSSSSIIQRIV